MKLENIKIGEIYLMKTKEKAEKIRKKILKNGGNISIYHYGLSGLYDSFVTVDKIDKSINCVYITSGDSHQWIKFSLLKKIKGDEKC